ncbi:MAG: sulfatase [Halobacteriaceae archaeon]
MPTDRPNVLFLLSDEHGYRYRSGRERASERAHTPTLDGLAERGVAFRDASCSVPLCTPSRVGLLTGREQRECGGWDSSTLGPWTPLPDLQTLPGAFAEAGYDTALVGKMHLGGDRQFVGFEERPYGDLTGGMGHQADPIDPPDTGRGIFDTRSRTADAGATAIPESAHQESAVVRETLAWLREHDARSDDPWFLCASFSRPHFPLTAPRRHLRRYWPDGLGDPPVGADSDAGRHPSAAWSRADQGAGERTPEEERRARAAYAACVDYLDELLGDLLGALDRDGLLEDTVVVYTSDHGEMAGEHGLWFKQTWHEASIRVPLLVETPAHRSGGRDPATVETPVSLLDLYPTLCGLAGVGYPDDLDGADLSDAVRTGAEPDRAPVVSDLLMPRRGEYACRVVRDGRYKYVGFRDAPELLFDVIADPYERENLAAGGGPDDPAAGDALDRLRAHVEETVDFDALEAQQERDREALSAHDRDLPQGTSGNMYHLPDGRVVDADTALYEPSVVGDPEDLFGDKK